MPVDFLQFSLNLKCKFCKCYYIFFGITLWRGREEEQQEEWRREGGREGGKEGGIRGERIEKREQRDKMGRGKEMERKGGKREHIFKRQASRNLKYHHLPSLTQYLKYTSISSSTVESLYSGHHWEPTFCPLQRGVPNSGASNIFPIGVV